MAIPSVVVQKAPSTLDGRSTTDGSWKSILDVKHDQVEEQPTRRKDDSGRPKGWDRWTKKLIGNKPGQWKPLSMTTPILAAIIILTLLIAASIEVIAQRSQKHGGLALSSSLDEIPEYAMMSYQYGPNVVAVLYSLIWTWLDLDVKRMQPWLELSRPEGALAKDSLFLDYPYGFVAFVPFRAFKQKHWPVFLSGTTMLIIFWLITPLQSSMLGTDTVSQTVIADITGRSQLMPVGDQEGVMSPEVMNHGYAVAWLEQPYPPFMTAKQGFLPYYMDDETQNVQPSTNWTATTTAYSTELECWPADISPEGEKRQKAFRFDNGKGCTFLNTLNFWEKVSMQYIGYYDSPHSNYWLASPDCPRSANATHQFLAVWVKANFEDIEDIPEFDITGLFCEPSYYKQDVQLAVEAKTMKPIESSIQPISERQSLNDDEFNSTAFEFLLAHGIEHDIQERDSPFSIVLDQSLKLFDMNIDIPTMNMVGFAMAGRDLDGMAYRDPEILENAYAETHKYLFSVALSHLLTNETSNSNTTATTTSFLSGVVVDRALSAAVEALLVLVAVLTGILLWMCHRSPCNLNQNPSSVDRLTQILAHSPETRQLFQSVDHTDEKALFQSLPEQRFRLRENHNGGYPSIEALDLGGEFTDKQHPGPKSNYYEPIRPFALRKEVGLLLVAILAGAVAGLAVLRREEARQIGFQRPSQDTTVNQIIESYVPTVFATFLEPFWVLLNRMLCLLQPFKELWAGKAERSRSIDTTYTSIPPQLTVWRALKSHHIILVMIGTIALLSNVLAVSLGALLNEEPTMISMDAMFKPTLKLQFNPEAVDGFKKWLEPRRIRTSRFQDHYYIAMAHIESGVPLPPWVSADYFFEPHELIDNTGGQRAKKQERYSLLTRGFGVRTDCETYPSSELPVSLPPEDLRLDTDCGDEFLINKAKISMRTSQTLRSSGSSSIEFVSTLVGGGELPSGLTEIPCGLPMTLGWGRTPDAGKVNGSAEASFAVCRPTFQTAMFNVTIDHQGYILSYDRTTDIETELDYPRSKNLTDQMMSQNNYQINQVYPIWHNDTLTRDWLSYLFVKEMGSRYMLDPEESVPDPEDLIESFSGLYKLLFSIFLGLNQRLFEKPSSSARVSGVRQLEQTKVFIDQPAFIITMVVLGINIVGAIIFYVRGVVFVLPRMPTSIGSILAYVAPSRMVTSQQHSSTFSFGRYLGSDGCTHLGIEMDPHVVPVDPQSLQGREKPAMCIPFLKKRKSRLGEGQPWV